MAFSPETYMKLKGLGGRAGGFATLDHSGKLPSEQFPAAISEALPSDDDPAMDGTAAPGESSKWSRSDHVHPRDSTIATAMSAALAAYPHDTVTGAAVTVTDGADVPLKSLTVTVTPMQSGEGTPTPDNVRPISPHSGVTVIHDGDPAILTQPENYAYTPGVEGAEFSITAAGTGLTYQWQYQQPDDVWKNGTGDGAKNDHYTLTGEITEARLAMLFRCVITNTSGNVIYSDPVRIYESGTTPAPITPDYEPYRPETVAFAFPGDICGATLDVLSGILTVNYGWMKTNSNGNPVIRIVGRAAITKTWSYSSSTNNGVCGLDDDAVRSTAELAAYCNMFEETSSGAAANKKFTINAGQFRFRYTSMPDWGTSAACNEYFKGHPLQCAFKLRTPVQVQLTPAQVKTVLGWNRITSDEYAADYDATATYSVGDLCRHDGDLYQCTTAITEAEAWTAAHWTAITHNGAIALDYRADPTMYIEKQIAALQAMILENE